MTSLQAAQINVRLDRELKSAGDALLDRVGVTPSQLVRALWEKLSRSEADARKTTDFLMMPASMSDTLDERARKLAALEAGDKIFYRFAEDLKLDPVACLPLTDEALGDAREELLAERFGASS